MNFKQITIIGLCSLLWFSLCFSGLAVTEEKTVTEPVKTYNLGILAESSRQKVKIDPPATKLIVKVEVGEGSIRCGDTNQTYNCAPGKPLTLSYEPSEAINQFWGENHSDVKYRLRIDVYEVAEVEQELEDNNKQ